jgi:two-component system chemotaxis response regulator CheB
LVDRVIVVGASAGGLTALRALCANLPADLPASVLVVQHITPTARSMLPELLGRAGPLPAEHATEGAVLRPGRIYVAPPDRHLLLADGGRMMLRRGPYENRTRPAIDALFRSAAVQYGPRCTGIVLSGLLDDGTAGLVAIKRLGGISMVQDPMEASWPDMPRNALIGDSIDHCLGAAEIAALLPSLLRVPPGAAMEPPPDLVAEYRISQQEVPAMADDVPTLGAPSAFGCPQCGGVLNELPSEKLPRFRCQIGHAYGGETLAAAQADVLEEALGTALRTHRERVVLFRRMQESAEARGFTHAAQRWGRAAGEAERSSEVIQAAMVSLQVREPEPGN